MATKPKSKLLSATIDTKHLNNECIPVLNAADPVIWFAAPGVIPHGNVQLYTTDLPADNPIHAWWLDASMFLAYSQRQKNPEGDVLMATLTAMRQQTPWVYLLIVGTFSRTEDGKVATRATPMSQRTPQGISWDSLVGFFQSIQEYGITISIGHQHQDMTHDLERLVNRSRDKKRIEPLRELLFLTPEQVMLNAIPGVGEKLLDELLQRAPLHAILEMLSDPRVQRNGNGKKQFKPELVHDVPINVFEATRELLGLPPGVGLLAVSAMETALDDLGDMQRILDEVEQMKIDTATGAQLEIDVTAAIENIQQRLTKLCQKYDVLTLCSSEGKPR